MPGPADDDPDRPSRPAGAPAYGSRPTVKNFPAVRPEGQQPGPPSAPPDASQESEARGPSRGELTLAVMMLAEQVEQLGGDVSEVRYLLGMTRRNEPEGS